MTMLSFADACERVKSGLDIIDIVRRHVILKKSGRNYSGKCPFHNDKSPSMNVSREKGIFKCFACGVGGDALTFLMRIENRTFGEVIRDLAQEQGIEIEREGQQDPAAAQQAEQKKTTRERILSLNDASLTWFTEQLNQLPTQSQECQDSWQSANAAIQNRYADPAVRQEVLSRFELGLALPGWDNLAIKLKSQFDFVQTNPDLLVEAGLASKRDHGQGHYDRFRNRLIIPIRDDQGKVVAFGARTLSDDDKPKYLNSPETVLYKKNQVLYGLWQARDTIRQSRTAVVMEGYFDVISAHIGGVTEAIGSCGTAMTEQHLRLLSRFGAEKIILAFDSDEAGLKAALNAIELMAPYLEAAAEQKSELSVSVLTVPDGKDPDDYIRQNGGDAFRDLMGNAKPYLEFQCDMAIRGADISNPEGRIQAVTRLTPVLAGIKRPIIRDEYLHRFAERLGVSQEALALEIRRYEQNQPNTRVGLSSHASQRFPVSINSVEKMGSNLAILPTPSTSFKRQNPAFYSRHEAVERTLLQLMLYNTESFSLMTTLLKPEVQAFFLTPIHRDILTGLLEEATTSPGQPSLETFLKKMNDLYQDKSDILHCLAELAMTADTFGESLSLNDLSGPVLQERLTTLASQQITHLVDGHRRQQLHNMKLDAARNEDEAIALTYAFRDQLAVTTPATPSTG